MWNSGVICFTGTARDCWHHGCGHRVLLLASCMAACRVFLLAPCVLSGSACCYWHRVLFLALCAIAGIMHGRWYRVLLLAPCVVADIAGYCGHRVLLLALFRVTEFTENPDRLFVGKFICQSRSDRGLLKQESVPNRVPDTVYRSRSNHRPELSFWQSGTDRYR